MREPSLLATLLMLSAVPGFANPPGGEPPGGEPPGGEPPGGAPPLTARQTVGRALFARTCIYCHGENGWATRKLAVIRGVDKSRIDQRDDLDPKVVAFVVRHGLGSMPAYTPTDLTADQIAIIVDYLTRRRAGG